MWFTSCIWVHSDWIGPKVGDSVQSSHELSAILTAK